MYTFLTFVQAFGSQWSETIITDDGRISNYVHYALSLDLSQTEIVDIGYFYDYCMWCGKLSNLKKSFCGTLQAGQLKAAAVTFFQKFNLLNCFTMHCAQAKKVVWKPFCKMEWSKWMKWTSSEKMCIPFLRLFCTFQAKLVFAIIRKSSS